MMRFYVAITDFSWFSYLSEQKPDEVNFWQPSGSSSFHVLKPGEPLLFKLHSPQNFIVGGGFFSHFTRLPVSLAWDAFGYKNGAQSFTKMRDRVWKYRKSQPSSSSDEMIGCILLQQPFFFETNDWIPIPTNWKSNIVRGKSFNTADAIGQKLWQEVQSRLASPKPVPDESVAIAVERYGKAQIVLPRLGQGSFRVIVADSYSRQCALSSSHILHILEAAHIRPYASGGTHSPTNGILLRQDVHTLFDRGYITVTPESRIEVSKRIKEEFNNGVEYYAMHGKQIHLPQIEQFRPATDLLTWHNENVFRS
jgi:putative restriction endonuclease